MRNLREILRLRYCAQLGVRQIHRSLQISVGAVSNTLSKAEVLKLDWQQVDALDDVALARLFYPTADVVQSSNFVMPDWPEVHRELSRKGMSKQLLWEEYTECYPNRCYSYSQFCHHYREWLKKQRRSMRQVHKAGEKLFVDFSGQTVPIVCSESGEIFQAQIFVAAMGASNYIYAEAARSQSLPDWLDCHTNALSFLGGVPEIIVPDNLKSGVSKACRYDPDVNPAYQQWASHYSTAVVPARPHKPKDKSKAEQSVQVVQRWILARLRKLTFFSVKELNTCIKALLIEANLKPFKQLPGCRQSWFEQLDKPALQPLPKYPYEYVEIKMAKVNIDYHVSFDNHLYSVPHQLVGERVEIHASSKLVTVFLHRHEVAAHPRQYSYGTSTNSNHMPQPHQRHQRWSAQRMLNWANDLGSEVYEWVQHQFKNRDHEEQAYRVCLGLLNLSRSYPAERINRACGLANHKQLYRLKNIKSILDSNQDQRFKTRENVTSLPQHHENIRGPQSFH